MDVTRHDTHLAAVGVDDTGAIGAHETRFGLALKSVDNLHTSSTQQLNSKRVFSSITGPVAI